MNELLNEYADMTYSDYESHIQGIVDSITKGEKQDQYKDWAKHPDVSVREALVKNGYELDILIHDPLSSMRMEVVRKDPTYIKEAFSYQLSATHWQTVYHELVKMIDPDPEVLIAFMKLGVPEELTEYESTFYNAFKIFRLQIEGASSQQTTLERTMTTAQLYNQKHPSWTYGLSTRAIRQVLNTETDLKDHGLAHKISDIFDAIITDGHGCTMQKRWQLVDEIVSRYGKEKHEQET
jgi:hypothetical protein